MICFLFFDKTQWISKRLDPEWVWGQATIQASPVYNNTRAISRWAAASEPLMWVDTGVAVKSHLQFELWTDGTHIFVLNRVYGFWLQANVANKWHGPTTLLTLQFEWFIKLRGYGVWQQRGPIQMLLNVIKRAWLVGAILCNSASPAQTIETKKSRKKQLNMSVSPDCGLFWGSVVMLGFTSMKNSGLSQASAGLRLPRNLCFSGSFLVAGSGSVFIRRKPNCGSPGRLWLTFSGIWDQLFSSSPC